MDYIKILYNIYRKFGATDRAAKLIVAQNMLETAFEGKPFNSPLFKTHNNIGGVIFIGQKNAVKGVPQPKNEKSPYFYAKFKSIEDSALAVYQTVWDEVKAASDTLTYSVNLKKAGYYAAPQTKYKSLLDYYYNQIKDLNLSSETTTKPQEKKK